MSIINFIFTFSLKRKLTPNDSFEILEQLVTRHCHQSPPYAEYLFNEKEKSEILLHVRNLYKFFLMYEISLTKFIDYNIISVQPFVPFVPVTDLKEGTPYSKYFFA